MNKKKVIFPLTNIILITSIIMTTGCISSGDVITPPGIPCDIAGVSANDTLIWNDTRNLFEPGEGGLGGGGTTYYADNTTLNLTGSVFSINNSIWNENLSWDGTYVNATGGIAYTAGSGLNLTGTEFSINHTIWGENLSWDGTYVNASGGGGAASVGGLYGLNVQTLAGDRTLYPGVDYIYQVLSSLANRIVTLSTTNATKGDRFSIRCNNNYGDSYILYIKQGATTLDQMYAGGMKEYIYDGSKWLSNMVGTSDADTSAATLYNVQLGSGARGYFFGVALGYSSLGNTYGVAIGTNAQGYNYGVGLGYQAQTGNQKHSVALGTYSYCGRVSEICHSVDGSYLKDTFTTTVAWCLGLNTSTPTEMLCGNVSNSRCVIKAKSVLSFNIMVTAKNEVQDEVARYSFEGLIKRNNSGNTVLVYLTKTVDYEDDATWDVNVTADDVNEALAITVTSDAANPVRWVARLDGVETKF